MERQLVSSPLKPYISGLKVAYWSVVDFTQIVLTSFDKCRFVETNIMKVLFNVFMLSTLDMMKFKNIARNSCEVNLVTLPIMQIRSVIKT